MDTNTWQTAAHLIWRESGNSGKEFTLLAGAAEAGRLSLHGWSCQEATAATAFGSWSIRTEGFWQARIIVEDESTGAIDAECSRPWMSSDRTITMNDGKIYQWRVTGWCSDSVEVLDPSGRCLMVIHTGDERRSFGDLFKTHGRMEIHSLERDAQRSALLAIISWYLLLLHRQEAASAVVLL